MLSSVGAKIVSSASSLSDLSIPEFAIMSARVLKPKFCRPSRRFCGFASGVVA